jgi:nitroreductase
MTNSYKYMHWWKSKEKLPMQGSAQLLFQFHKIEKGLCMPGEYRIFAVNPVKDTVSAVRDWDKNGFPKNDPILIGALHSLASYRNRIEKYHLDTEGEILPLVEETLNNRDEEIEVEQYATPIEIGTGEIEEAKCFEQIAKLYRVRRSYRDYADKEVEEQAVKSAVQLAQLSPSACNRQPCRVYEIRSAKLRQQLLSYQNGNRGFGHKIPLLLVVTSDMRNFFDASERNEPYIDGGLFSMSLIVALQAQGLITCCLNLCVSPKTDKAIHGLLELDNSERLLMYIAVGYPKEKNLVPRSIRRNVEDILKVL